MHPAMEFRCFVREKELVAISQRDCSNHYSFLMDQQRDLMTRITSFFESKIKQTFAETNCKSLSLVSFLPQFLICTYDHQM